MLLVQCDPRAASLRRVEHAKYMCEKALADFMRENGSNFFASGEPEPEPSGEQEGLQQEETAERPKQLKGAPKLVMEKTTPFSEHFNAWLVAGVLELPWNWKDHLKKVRGKKEKARQKAAEAAAKEAAKAAKLAAKAAEANEAAAGGDAAAAAAAPTS